MTAGGLRRLTAVLLLAVAGTWSMAAEKEESPHLDLKICLNPQVPIESDYLAFSPDGKQLRVLGPGRVWLWDVASGKRIAVLRHGNCWTAACSPDGKFIATYRTDIWADEIRIWDAQKGERLANFDAEENISRLLYSPDGKTVIAFARSQLLYYDAKDGKLLRTIAREGRLCPVLSSRPTKRPLMVCGLRLYDALTGDLRYELVKGSLPGGDSPLTVITADERRVATSRGGHITIWLTKAEDQKREKREYLTLRQSVGRVNCITFSPDDKILVAGYRYDIPPAGFEKARGGVLVFDAASGELVANQDTFIADVRTLAFSPDGRLLATADFHGKIKLWEVPEAWRKKAR